MAKDYTVRLEIDDSGAVQKVDKLQDALDSTAKKGVKAGGDISRGLQEAKRGIVGIVNDLTGGLASKFMDVKDAIQGSIKGMSGLKAAIAGTGIGLLVIAAGFVATHFEDIKSWAMGTNFELADQIELQQKLVEQSQLQVDLFIAMENSLRLQGVTEKEILQRKKIFYDEQIAQLAAQLELQKQQVKEQNAQVELQVGFLKNQFGSLGKTIGEWFFDPVKTKEEGQKTLDETTKTLATLKSQSEGFQLQINAIGKEETKKYLEETKLTRLKAQAGELEEIKGLEEAKLQIKREAALESGNIAAGQIQDQLDKEKISRDKRIAIEKQVSDTKVQFQEMSFNAIGSLTEAFAGKNEKGQKRAFKIQKALSATQAVIDTYKSINAIFASAAANPATVLFPGFPFVQAGLAGLAGFANVKKILSAQFGGGGSASVDTGGGGGGGGSAFAGFNVQQPTAPLPTVQGQLKSEPVQAYVLSSNVSDAENARFKIENQARL